MMTQPAVAKPVVRNPWEHKYYIVMPVKPLAFVDTLRNALAGSYSSSFRKIHTFHTVACTGSANTDFESILSPRENCRGACVCAKEVRINDSVITTSMSAERLRLAGWEEWKGELPPLAAPTFAGEPIYCDDCSQNIHGRYSSYG
jgi:hypothetical protein